jgi:peroxiredoxin (alkyl hydroperoxide reductase subunit C)
MAAGREKRGLNQPNFKRRVNMGAMVGKPAPDFMARAFFKGKEREVKLSEYRGKWVMLCFYPADFTCV